MKKLRILLVLPVLFLVAVLAIAAFDARGGGSQSDSGARASRGIASDSQEQSGGSAESPSDGAVGKQVVATEPMSKAVISTGQVTLRPESMGKARSEVIRMVAAWGGTVADEQTSSDERGRIVDSTMTLRVPTAKFSEALNAFGGLGTVEQVSRTSEDVTTKVIDNQARVRAAERSIRQIENLLGRAQQLSDIIAIESDLARRQADLDSLKSQQAYLADQTSLSTINVYLSRNGAPAPETKDARGFLAGLDGGWTALKGATVILLTVLGALLPFALVLLVLGVPLWLAVRRRLGTGPINAGSAPARSA